ncbi:MAG: Fur family transcriptional regulator [Acidimicrobiales bacterium]|jgi:Fur family ferric uptake transcriptional regulator
MSHLRDELQAVGLRVTAQRLAVFAVVREQGQHLRADEVIEATHARLQTVSTQAVYSALSALCDTGLVRRIEPAGSPAMYEARVADNHHHVVCRTCGVVADVDCAVGAAPCLDPSSTGGFVIDEAEVTFWGLCPACDQKAPTFPLDIQGESL